MLYRILTALFLSALFISCQSDQDDTTPSKDSIILNPEQGRLGSTVKITGASFSSTIKENTVTFNGVEAEISKVSLSTTVGDELNVTVPLTATSGKVSVKVKGVMVAGPSFTIVGPHKIKSLSSTEGVAGDEILISGSDFSEVISENVVTLNGVSLEVISASSTTIKVKLPETATSGKIIVSILGLAVEGPSFIMKEKESKLPVINSFSPTSAAVGARVTIYGENFSLTPSQNTILFNGVAALVIEVSDDASTLLVEVPEGVSTGPISVSVNSKKVISSTSFIIAEALELNSVTPFYPLGGIPGTIVSIHGYHFSPIASKNSVKINGISIPVIDVAANDSEGVTLFVKIPKAELGDGGIIEVTVNGKSAATTIKFNYSDNVIVVNSTPESGNAGTQITIGGYYFSPDKSDMKVFFDNTEGEILSSTSGALTSSLTVKVPTGISPGQVYLYVKAYDNAPVKMLKKFTVN